MSYTCTYSLFSAKGENTYEANQNMELCMVRL
jgi:hypothetical protein